jgi:hypothetical protein
MGFFHVIFGLVGLVILIMAGLWLIIQVANRRERRAQK